MMPSPQLTLVPGRRHRGDYGLCTANGGFMSKHSIGIYSTDPGPGSGKARPWVRPDPLVYQAALNAKGADCNTVRLSERPAGWGLVETYTVEHGAGGPTRAIVWGTLRDTPEKGMRFIATSTDPIVLRTLVEGEGAGTEGWVATDTATCRATFSMMPAAPSTPSKM